MSNSNETPIYAVSRTPVGVGTRPSKDQELVSVIGDARYSQLLDEADHKRCTTGNQQALLTEKVESLRSLEKELRKDDWKYEAPKTGQNAKMFLSDL
jgi:hypothetical protein